MTEQQKDITILGGGIMGLMTAYTLAQTNNNHKITIHDPAGFPADNASLMAGGMLAPYSEIEHMNIDWVKAGLASIKIWRDIPLDTGFTQNGSLLIAHPQDRHILERFKTHLPPELQTPQNVKTLEPQTSQTFQNGILLKEEAHLSPTKTMQSMCEYLDNHKNITLNTQHPKPKTQNLTIDCTGMAAKDKNLRGVKGEILIVKNPEFTLTRPIRIMHPRYPLYIVPRDNHHFMIGATIIESNEDQTISIRSGMELMSALYSLHQSFAEAQIIEIKAGIRPSYPDNLPRITINDNRISCNGLFRHGYLLAPIMAQCVTDHINGKTNTFMPLFTKGQNHESDNQRAA